MNNRISPDRLGCLSGSWLKLIAVISMLIDHSAHILWTGDPAFRVPLFVFGGMEFTGYFILRKIGRIAFPIFCFLLAEGYQHTRDRRKYGRDLLIFALLSELPFNLMSGGTLWYPEKQNVFVTLFLGFVFLYVYDLEWNELRKIAAFLILSLVAVLAKADYGLPGALLVLLLYALRQRPALRMILAYPLLSGGIAAFAAFIPISLYNGQRGFIRGKGLKYAFYLFYPVHILLLWMVKNCL